MSVCVHGEGAGGGLKVPAGLSWDSQSRVNGTQRELWRTGPTLKHSTGWKRSTGVSSAGQCQEYCFSVLCNRPEEPMGPFKMLVNIRSKKVK